MNNNNSSIDISICYSCENNEEHLQECFICMDKGGNLRQGVCKCNTMMHAHCQKKLIKISQSVYCKVCKESYNNISVYNITCYRILNIQGLFFIVSIILVISYPFPIIMLAIDLKYWNESLLPCLIIFSIIWFLSTCYMMIHCRYVKNYFDKYNYILTVNVK